MAASSPYKDNNYEAISSFRGHKLPINEIAKATMAINAYWDDGARRVKKAYENVLDLKLRTTDNKQIRDQFIQDAQKEITKVSAMNLGDASVQRQGQAIFSPIMKDQDIVGEDYVVRNGEQELATGESFRTKDGGKNYNPISVNNIQYEQNLLTKDPTLNGLNKRDGWKTIANIQSKYTPYTDISKEWKQIKDIVTANEMNTANLSGNHQYIETLKKKGVSKERLLTAMQEMGSPQLKAQLAVEGRSAFYNKLESNPAGVDEYFQQLGAAYYDNKVLEYKGEIGKLKYENYMIPKESTDPSTKAANLQRIKSGEEAITTIQGNIDNIVKKEKPEYLQSLTGLGNINNLSSSLPKIEQLWQQSSMDNMAGKLAYQSSTYDIKANPIWIADQNIRLGVEKLKLSAAEHEYNKVNDLRNYELEKWKAMNPKGIPGAGTGNGNPLLPGGSGGNVVNIDYPDPAQMNADDFNKLVKQRLAASLDKDEPIREITITNLLGGNAWIGIQENLTTGKKIGEGVLHDFEIEDAAKFMEAYNEKKDINVDGMYLPNDYTIDDYIKVISNMNPKAFKELIGNMTTTDPDMVADLAGKWAIEKGNNGKQVSAEFRASYNKRTAQQMNISDKILAQLPARLGEYKDLFNNGGKVPMTDGEINAAWQKGMINGSLVGYFRVGTYVEIQKGKPYWQIQRENTANKKLGKPLNSSTPITKEEYEKIIAKPGAFPGAIKKAISLEEFTNIIKERTNPVYYNSEIENNKTGILVTFDKGEPEEKTKTINYTATQIPTLQGTDANEDHITIFDYIQRHPEEVTSYEIKNAGYGQPLPMVRFKMKEPSTKADEATKASAKNVNTTWFPVNGLDPSFSMSSNSSSGMPRLDGATVAVAPAKIEGYPEAGITIRNASRSAAVIDPRIIIKDLYTYINGVSTPVTSTNLERSYSDQFGVSLQLDIQNNLTRVETFLAAFVTDIETINARDKELQEKKKK